MLFSPNKAALLKCFITWLSGTESILPKCRSSIIFRDPLEILNYQIYFMIYGNTLVVKTETVLQIWVIHNQLHIGK